MDRATFARSHEYAADISGQCSQSACVCACAVSKRCAGRRHTRVDKKLDALERAVRCHECIAQLIRCIMGHCPNNLLTKRQCHRGWW